LPVVDVESRCPRSDMLIIERSSYFPFMLIYGQITSLTFNLPPNKFSLYFHASLELLWLLLYRHIIDIMIHCFTFLLLFFSQAQSARLPHFGGVDVHFSGMIDCFVQVVKSKGIFSLWNGLTANTIKVPVHSCIPLSFKSQPYCILYQSYRSITGLLHLWVWNGNNCTCSGTWVTSWGGGQCQLMPTQRGEWGWGAGHGKQCSVCKS